MTSEAGAELNDAGKMGCCFQLIADSGKGADVLDRLTVPVTFDPAKGYVATLIDVAAPVTALSLNGLRRRVEALVVLAGRRYIVCRKSSRSYSMTH